MRAVRQNIPAPPSCFRPAPYACLHLLRTIPGTLSGCRIAAHPSAVLPPAVEAALPVHHRCCRLQNPAALPAGRAGILLHPPSGARHPHPGQLGLAGHLFLCAPAPFAEPAAVRAASHPVPKNGKTALAPHRQPPPRGAAGTDRRNRNRRHVQLPATAGAGGNHPLPAADSRRCCPAASGAAGRLACG